MNERTRIVVLRLHERDPVACALRDLAAGERVRVAGQGELVLRDAIPLGHKVALRDLPADAAICKYGTDIGRTTRPVRAGEHVHLHNLTGLVRAGESGSS